MLDIQLLPKLRPTGPLERFSTTRHALGFYNNVGLSARYSRPGSCHALEPLVYKALAQVVERHSVLTSALVNEDSPSAYFAQLQQIDLREVVTFTDIARPFHESPDPDEYLQKVLESQHSSDYKQRYGELPFWRVVVLNYAGNTPDFVLCFIFSHSVGDGQSGLAFHRHFHAALVTIDTAEATDTFNPIVVSPSTPMTPSLETLHKLPLTIWYLARMLWNEWFPANHLHSWRGKPISFSVDKRKRRFTWITFPPPVVNALLVLSRQHSVTVTAALQSALATSLFANVPEEYKDLHVDGAVSLRRFIPAINDDSFGNFVSRYIHHHDRSQSGSSLASDTKARDAIWKEAKKVKISIDTELGKKGKDSVVGLLRWAGPLIPFFKKRENKVREESFELSNIGVFKYDHVPTESEWKVGRMVFSQSADVCGPPFHTTLVTGKDGCLTAGFSWLEAMLEPEWVEKVAKDFETTVTNLANGPASNGSA